MPIDVEKVLGYVKDLKTLVGLTEKDAETLVKYRDVALKWRDDVVKMFYDTLFSYPPTASVFMEGERKAREETLRRWYERLFEGNFDDDFWIWQWYVGVVHIKRKIYNRYMLAMMGRVQAAFAERAFSELPLEQAMELAFAFKRVTDVIAGIIAEGYHLTYIESLEAIAGVKPAIAERMMKLHIEKVLREFGGRGR